MNRPDSQTMTQKELQQYFLTHRDDEQAFHAYVDKLHTEGNWVEMPPVNSVEELEKYPEFVAWCLRHSQSNGNP